jgi:phospholipase B1
MRLLVACLCLANASAGISRFNCTVGKVPPKPTNVSLLHPGHVKFVIALGDSITAAFAARGKVEEDRDISWSIGEGSANQLTLPWMLKQYSGGTQGQSTAARIPKDVTKLPHNDYHPLTDHLNIAESEGAVHRGSMVEQWGFLREQMGKYKNFDSEWKVLTLWMTANDVCGKCDAPLTSEYLEKWAAGADAMLHNISTHTKNIYVNLVSTLDLSNVARLQKTNIKCLVEHKLLLEECGCIDRGNATQLKQLDENVHTMNTRLHKLATDWRAKLHDREDMAVVLQPFQESIGPSLDISFLNTLDCFHPSAKAHESLAVGLWDSMLCHDRINRCGIHFADDMPVTCPTETSVFYTGPDVVPGPPP